MARKDAGPSVNRTPGRWALVAIFAAVVLSLFAFRRLAGDAQAEAQTTTAQQKATDPQRPLPRPGHPQHDVMAIVNGQDVSRQALAQACVERYGEEVLESLVNKRLIQHHCHNRGVQITDAEIDVEVTRMAERFKLTREQWVELLKNERNITAEEYKRDIIWPTLALRKLAAEDLAVSQADLEKAYEMRYGPSVQARLIVVSSAARAAELQRQLAANPDDFARVAMQESVDEGSASIGGLIQPIRKHLAGPEFEKIAFSLQQNEVSAVAPIGDQFAILKCEGHLPGATTPLAMVQAELTEQIKEEKLRGVANNLFATLQKSATIKNIYNDPQLRQQMPGVVATVNGEQVTMAELGKECLLRHGSDVLEMEISQLLLRQELKRAGITVTDADVQAEMAHGAVLAGVVDAQGRPDMKAWVKAATEEQGVSYDLYVRDSVWPSAALKKLTGGTVQVTTDDLQKGFEANYGERVRCRAIVLGDMRRAQEVWSKARRDGSKEYFCKLAAEYSIEPTSKNLEGEVPPLRRNGGQPQLEDAAYALKPGEMSGIVQVADKYVILLCEGRTEPVSIRPEEVRDVLTRDIFEKKIRIAMAEKYDMIRKQAKIDNYLAGTSQAPATKQAGAPARVDSAVRQTSDQR